MVLQGGDVEFPDGDSITVENTSGSDVEAGALLVVTGYNTTENRPEVQPADSNGENDYHAVAAGPIPAGDYNEGVFGGTPWVRVDNGADVTAGQEVAPSATPGVATDATAGGTGKGDVFLTGETDIGGTKYAVVHLG
jgi:hypothetical protein